MKIIKQKVIGSITNNIPLPTAPIRKSFTAEQRREIYERAKNGEKQEALAAEFGCHSSTISLILNRRKTYSKNF